MVLPTSQWVKSQVLNLNFQIKFCCSNFGRYYNCYGRIKWTDEDSRVLGTGWEHMEKASADAPWKIPPNSLWYTMKIINIYWNLFKVTKNTIIYTVTSPGSFIEAILYIFTINMKDIVAINKDVNSDRHNCNDFRKTMRLQQYEKHAQLHDVF